MIQHMQKLIDENSAPKSIVIKYNGTTTTMYKTMSDGEVLYIGNPRSRDNVCRFGLTLRLNGFMTGTAALNFITLGGWGKGSERPSFQDRTNARGEFIRAVFTACILNKGMALEEESGVKDHLETDLQCAIEECDWANLSVEKAASVKEDLSLIGVTSADLLILQHNNLTVTIDVARVVSKYVNPKYAKVLGGIFDAESLDIAITSALPLGVQRLLEKNGLRLKKVSRRKKNV
jgi:hypothetical protein